MTSRQLKLWGKLLICAVLLLWIFHSIFLQEGRKAWIDQGGDWDQLTGREKARVAWRFGPGELWQTLTLVDAISFSSSVAVVGVILFLGILRWHYALKAQHLHLEWKRTIQISMVAHFFNSFLLGTAGGDLMKAYYTARETRHQKIEAVLAVAVDRLLGLWSLLLFSGVMMVLHWATVRSSDRLMAVAGFILLLLLGCTAFMVLALRGGISHGWPGARAWLRKLSRGEFLEQCLETCRRYGRHRRLLARMLLLSMTLNVFCVVQVQLLALGLNLEMPQAVFYLLVPMIICISALPITPSGLGVRENLYVALLSIPALGVAPTAALALSLLAFAGSLLWSLAGGVVYLFSRNQVALPMAEEPEVQAGR